MQAVRLFWHSVRQVFGNLAVALRISLGPMLIALGAGALVASPLIGKVSDTTVRAEIPDAAPGYLYLGIPLVVLLWIVALVWIAVA